MMARIALLTVVLAAALLVPPIPEARAADPLRVLLPADATTYFETSQPASIGLRDPVQPGTLVVTLDGFDVTADFVAGPGGATATLIDLAPGPHVLEATALGEVFDPFLFQFVIRTFVATSEFFVAPPTSVDDFINLGIDHLAGRDLPAAREAFLEATTLDRRNQPATLLLALTQIAILLDPRLPGGDPSLLDSAGEFLDALGFPPEGRDLLDFTAMLPMDGGGNIVLPPTSPTIPEAQAFAALDVLPRIHDAMNQLKRIKKKFVYRFPADRLGAGLAPVEVDYGDVKILLGALYLADAAISIGNSYNLDPGAVDILVQKANDRTLDVQQDVILANPDLLRLVSPKDVKKIRRTVQRGINSLLKGLKAIDAETDPQNDDLLVIAPEQFLLELKIKKFLLAVRRSFSRETVIPDIRFDPSDPHDFDFSMPIYLGALVSSKGPEVRDLLPQFAQRPDGTNVVLSRTFPDSTFGGLVPEVTQLQLIFFADQLPPKITVEATGFPTDVNMFHIAGTIVEEDLAAGLDLANWQVKLRLFDASGLLSGGGPFDVTEHFPLFLQPDGTVSFDSFIRFVDPVANHAVLTFEANDLNGNISKVNVGLDLFSAVFLDPSSAIAVDPIHPGDGLNGRFVQTGTSSTCCEVPDLDIVEPLLELEEGDPGVISVTEQMITSEIDLTRFNGRFPDAFPGVARLSGFIRITAPGAFDFRIIQCCRMATRMRIAGTTILDFAARFSAVTNRAVYFPVAGFYSFEFILATTHNSPRLEIRMAPGAGGSASFRSAFLQPTILYKTLDTDGDGATDSVELESGLDPNDPTDLDTDTDGDGLTGREELALGTKADNPDTDGDTLSDGEEVVPGTDGFTTNPTNNDTDGDGRPDNTDPIPLLAQADLFATPSAVLPSGAVVAVQLRLRDGTPVAKEGIPFRLSTTGSARFAATAVNGTVISGGGSSLVNVETSSLGQVTIFLTNTVAQTVNVFFSDNTFVGIDGQLFFSDFESDDGGFTQVEGSQWELGTPTAGPEKAASGLRAWWTNPGGVFAFTNTIESGPIVTPSVSTSGGVRARFTHFFKRASCCPVGRFQFRFETSGSPTNLNAFSSSTEEYVLHERFLTSSTNSTFHLGFLFRPSSGANLWAVDDVQVYLPRVNVTQVEFQ